MKKLLSLFILLPLVFFGCTSLEDSFLVQKLDVQSKSKALTSAGIAEYDLHVVHRQEFDQIPRIKEFFNMALRFDPTNLQAQQYLSTIDNYKNQQLQANLKDATKTLAKPKRTDEDNYALFVSLQTAVRIDPSNASAQKMMGDTAQDRAKLVDAYLTKAKAALSGVDDKTPAATREKQYTEAFVNANKATDIDPGNSVAQGQVSSTKAALAIMVTARVTSIQKLAAVGKFADARTQLTSLNDLNQKLDNNFEPDVKNAGYSLNFTWAKALFGLKDYATAGVKTDAALAISRTDEALALKRKILDASTKVEASVPFETSLKEIDRLMAANELLGAHRNIDSLAKVTKDQAKLQLLDDRNQTILLKLKDIYSSGVQAYRDEDFKTAIDLLQTVVGIQVDYEQASDYLDKAKQKESLVEQVGGGK